MQRDKEFLAVWIETERSLDKKMICETFQIDPNRLVFIDYDPNAGAEGVLNMLYGFMTALSFDMVVINSLKCLVPTKILEEAMEAQTPAVQARLWSKMVSKFLALVASNETAFVLITHTYTGIGAYGAPQVISGGNAIKYWSSLTLSFNRKNIGSGEPITKEDGVHIEVSIKKNHCVSDRFPYKKFDYYAIFGEGTETILTVIKPLADAGLIEVKGASYALLDSKGQPTQKFRGKAAFRQYMVEHPDIMEDLLEKLGDRKSTVKELSEEEVADIKEEELDIEGDIEISEEE